MRRIARIQSIEFDFTLVNTDVCIPQSYRTVVYSGILVFVPLNVAINPSGE